MVQERFELGMRHRKLHEVLNPTSSGSRDDTVAHLGLARVHRRANMNDNPHPVNRTTHVPRLQKVTDESLGCASVDEIVDLRIDVKRSY
jgi:hypothetical protein